jgi:inner membrane protein
MPAYQRSPKAYALAAGCAMLPDVDMLIHAIGFDAAFLIPWLAHRGITHSLSFALLTGVLVTLLAYGIQWRYRFAQWGTYAFLFAAAGASHPLLDACTNGGQAIALFAPFTWKTYFAPWRPLEVSPFWLGIFSPRGVVVARSELLWLALPCALLWALTAEREHRGRR